MTRPDLKSLAAATVLSLSAALAAVPVAAQDDGAVPRLRPLDFAPFEAAFEGLDPEIIGALDQVLPTFPVPRLQALMAAGELSSETLTLYLLHRAAASDDTYRTFIEVNPQALEEARAADALFAEGTVKSPIQGIPVTLKDNIATAAPMHTTGGAEVLRDNIAPGDAPLVAQLREGGAVILGKANLSEFAGAITLGTGIGGATAMAGQGVNPYGAYPTGGSSSGSAGGVALGFTIVSVGSETSGSLIAPSAWQGVVGMKPSRGVVSGEGVIPLILNNDSPGPIARSVTDLAMLLAVIDSTDIAYGEALDVNALNGVTAGVLATELAAESGNADLLGRIAATLTLTGADIVPAQMSDESGAMDQFTMFLASGVRYDMMPAIGALVPGIDTPEALHDYNAAEPEHRIPFGDTVFQSFIEGATNTSEDQFHAMATTLTEAAATMLDNAFAATGAEVLVSIDNTHSQSYATAGYPAITVPLGLRTGGGVVAAMGGDGAGMPAGVTLIGKQGADAALIGYAFAFEQASRYRVLPTLTE